MLVVPVVVLVVVGRRAAAAGAAAAGPWQRRRPAGAPAAVPVLEAVPVPAAETAAAVAADCRSLLRNDAGPWRWGGDAGSALAG